MSTLAERAANVALYSFESAELPTETFQVVRFEGTEGISQPFRFDIQLVSKVPDIAFADVVNQPATFTMMRGQEAVPVHGIVTNFAQHGRTADYVAYQVTLRARLHRLSLNHRSRIFQEKTVEEILRTVLEENGFSRSDVRFVLKASYSPREYCVQYQETDLNFLDRLMEFEGMYYYFDHRDGQDTLVVTDQKGTHELMPSPSTLPYHEGAGGMVGERQETVDRFVCKEQMVTGAVKLRDYDNRTPDTMTVDAEQNGEKAGTQYEYGEHFRDPDRGNRLATVRSEELEAQRRVFHGESSSMGLRSGYLFTLDGYYRHDRNGDYLVTEIEHRGSQRAGLNLDVLPALKEEETDVEYRNEYTCIPATVQYRPPRETPKPEAPGVLTATIESAGGDYAYIDDEGRYRAQMHFDQRENRAEGGKTLPVRMTQPYSGPDYGMHFPNHAGTEMIVAFENGDIDRPVALGTTPNPSNKSPSVAKNKMENVLRTHAGNQLLMDDTNKETKVALESADQHAVRLDDKNDRLRLSTTGQHEATLDDKNKNVRVQTKTGHTVLMDDKNKKITVQSKKGHFMTINDDKEVLTIADESRDNMFSIDIGNETLTIKTKNGDIDLHAPEGTIDIQAKKLHTESSGDTTMKAANLDAKAKSDMNLKATNLTATADQDYEQSGTTVTSKAAESHEIKGADVSSEATEQNDVKGGMVKVEAVGMNEIKGTTIKIN